MIVSEKKLHEGVVVGWWWWLVFVKFKDRSEPINYLGEKSYSLVVGDGGSRLGSFFWSSLPEVTLSYSQVALS